MIDQLIEEGEKLESQVKPGSYGIGKILEGVDLEKWVAKVILYLEKHHASSSQTKKAIDSTKGKVGYDEYEFLLGVVKAIKEFK